MVIKITPPKKNLSGGWELSERQKSNEKLNIEEMEAEKTMLEFYPRRFVFEEELLEESFRGMKIWSELFCDMGTSDLQKESIAIMGTSMPISIQY